VHIRRQTRHHVLYEPQCAFAANESADATQQERIATERLATIAGPRLLKQAPGIRGLIYSVEALRTDSITHQPSTMRVQPALKASGLRRATYWKNKIESPENAGE